MICSVRRIAEGTLDREDGGVISVNAAVSRPDSVRRAASANEPTGDAALYGAALSGSFLKTALKSTTVGRSGSGARHEGVAQILPGNAEFPSRAHVESTVWWVGVPVCKGHRVPVKCGGGLGITGRNHRYAGEFSNSCPWCPGATWG